MRTNGLPQSGAVPIEQLVKRLPVSGTDSADKLLRLFRVVVALPAALPPNRAAAVTLISTRNVGKVGRVSGNDGISVPSLDKALQPSA